MHFMRYDVSSGEWSELSVPSEKFKNGTCMTWDGDHCLYVLLGGSYNDTERNYFFRYDIVLDEWTRRADTPSPGGQGAGDAIDYVPGKILGIEDDSFIYAIIGARSPYQHGTKFARYSVSENQWTLLESPPTRTDDGCSLVWTGSDALYALAGEYIETEPTCDFYRYSIEADQWYYCTPIPVEDEGVGDGGSMVYIGGSKADTIYAFSGGYAYPEAPGNRIFGYSLGDSTWTELNGLPESIGDQNGPRLGYAAGHIFCWRGCFDDPSLWRNEFETFINPTVTTDSDSYTPGETVHCTAAIANEGYKDTGLTVDAVLDARLPWGPEIPIGSMSGISLNPDTHLSSGIDQGIPLSAPPGTYTLILRVFDSSGKNLLAVAEHDIDITE